MSTKREHAELIRYARPPRCQFPTCLLVPFRNDFRV